MECDASSAHPTTERQCDIPAGRTRLVSCILVAIVMFESALLLYALSKCSGSQLRPAPAPNPPPNTELTCSELALVAASIPTKAAGIYVFSNTAVSTELQKPHTNEVELPAPDLLLPTGPLYVCMYVCMYVCVQVYIHTYILACSLCLICWNL
jgi:hypothetical protein